MGTVDTQKLNLFFERAGTIKLTRRNSNGVLSTDPKDIYISNERIVKSVTQSVSKEMTEIMSGNSPFPADVRPKKLGATFDVGLNSFDRQLFRFATGAEITEAVDGSIGMVDKHIIPADGVLVLPFALSSVDGIVVKGATEEVNYTKVEASPVTAGSFSASMATNAITFAVADAGKQVLVNAMYKGNTSADVLAKTPKDATYQLELIGKVGAMQGEVYEMSDHITVDSVKFKGEIKPPAKQLEVADWTLSFDAVEPTGDKVVTWTYVKKDALEAFTAPPVPPENTP